MQTEHPKKQLIGVTQIHLLVAVPGSLSWIRRSLTVAATIPVLTSRRVQLHISHHEVTLRCPTGQWLVELPAFTYPG